MKVKRILFVLLMSLSLWLPLTVKARDEASLRVDISIGSNNSTVYIKEKLLYVNFEQARFTITGKSGEKFIDQIIDSSVVYSYKFKANGQMYFSDNHRTINNLGFFIMDGDVMELQFEGSYGTVYVDGDIFNNDQEFAFEFRWDLMKISSNDNLIINDVENPYTLDEIKAIAGLFVVDAHDGNITHKITEKSNTYTGHETEIGKKQVVFQVVNLSGHISEYTVNIFNYYYGKPKISGTNQLTYEYKSKDSITIEEIRTMYTVEDNFDDDIEITIKENNVNFSKVGTYNLVLEAVNKTKGATTFNVYVNVVDTTAPIITDDNSGTIRFSFDELPNNAMLLQGLTATDNVDGDITNKIIVKKNEIGKHKGTYQVYYQVIDAAGNIGYFERTYEIISNYEPQFFVSDNLLTIRDVHSMTPDQIIALIINLSEINYKSYEVLEDTYSLNSQTPGDYHIVLSVVDQDGQEHIIKQNINVFSISEERIETSKLPIFIVLVFVSAIIVVNYYVFKKIHKR